MAFVLSCGSAMAQTSERWVADGTKAQAVLPLPRDNDAVTAVKFSCAAQKWTLAIETGLKSGKGKFPAEMRVDARTFSVSAATQAGGIFIAIPREALDPLKTGLRWEIDFSGEPEEVVGDMTLPLRGSRIAITAMEETCSPRDMSAYKQVSFSENSAYIGLARQLRRKDMDAFTLATTAQAKVDAGIAVFKEGRRVLFTRLCGSAWYFGRSGCNITGFAPRAMFDGPEAETTDADTPDWLVVYDTENALLYTDPKSASDGWADIIALPARSQQTGKVWRWAGNTYVPYGDLPESEDGEPLPLRLSQD